MNSKHRKTYAAIFQNPIRSNVRWSAIESLFKNQGIVEEAEGARVLVTINGVSEVFHRPHPGDETDKGALKSVRKFLDEAGVDPNEKYEQTDEAEQTEEDQEDEES